MCGQTLLPRNVRVRFLADNIFPQQDSNAHRWYAVSYCRTIKHLAFWETTSTLAVYCVIKLLMKRWKGQNLNTPKVQELLHPVPITRGYNQNYMKYIQTKYNLYLKPVGSIYLFFHLVYNFLLSLKMYTFEGKNLVYMYMNVKVK